MADAFTMHQQSAHAFEPAPRSKIQPHSSELNVHTAGLSMTPRKRLMTPSRSDPSVYHEPEQCPRRCPVPAQPSPGLRVDAEDGGLKGTSAPLAGHGRRLCHLSQLPLFSLFSSLPGSPGSGDGCAAPQLGPSPGASVPSVGFDSAGPSQAPLVIRRPDDTDRSILASIPSVSGSSGSGSGSAACPPSLSRSSQTAAFPLSSYRRPQAVAS